MRDPVGESVCPAEAPCLIVRVMVSESKQRWMDQGPFFLRVRHIR